MTVKELIKQLQRMPEDMPVHMAYQYGDYWRTTVAPKIEVVKLDTVKYSGYHSMDALSAYDGDYEHREDGDLREVVVIR